MKADIYLNLLCSLIDVDASLDKAKFLPCDRSAVQIYYFHTFLSTTICHWFHVNYQSYSF